MVINKTNKKINRRSLIAVFIGFIFILIAVYYLILKPNPTNNAAWTVYSDNQFFKIQYPPTWVLNNKPGSGHAGFYIEDASGNYFEVTPYLTSENNKDMNIKYSSLKYYNSSLDKRSSFTVSKGDLNVAVSSNITALNGNTEENNILKTLSFINEVGNQSLAEEAIPQVKEAIGATSLSIYKIYMNGKYISGNASKVKPGEGGPGFGYIAMKKNGQWVVIYTGNAAVPFACADFRQRSGLGLDDTTMAEIKALSFCNP